MAQFLYSSQNIVCKKWQWKLLLETDVCSAHKYNRLSKANWYSRPERLRLGAPRPLAQPSNSQNLYESTYEVAKMTKIDEHWQKYLVADFRQGGNGRRAVYWAPIEVLTCRIRQSSSPCTRLSSSAMSLSQDGSDGRTPLASGE